MFKTAADVGKGLRKQIVPMMKSKGFNLRVTTSKESYYHDGNVRVQITKVPTNFPIWIDEYSKWRVTPNAERLVQTIKERIEGRYREIVQDAISEAANDGLLLRIEVSNDEEFLSESNENEIVTKNADSDEEIIDPRHDLVLQLIGRDWFALHYEYFWPVQFSRCAFLMMRGSGCELFLLLLI